MLERLIPRVIHWFDTHRKISILVLFVSLALVLYPRFNRNDIALIRPFVGLQQGELPVDVHNYINFTEYFKGRMPLDQVMVPFSYRPLAPYLASFLPVASLLGINIINLLSIWISIVCLYLILKKDNFSFGLSIAGCLLYIISFPVFYYGSSGYIDAASMGIIFLIVTATVYKKYLIVPLLFLIAAFTKETIIVTIPFVIFSFYQSASKEEKWKAFSSVFLSIIFFITGYLYCRSAFATITTVTWLPVLSRLQDNLARPKTYLSFLFSFGIPGVLATAQVIREVRGNSGKGIRIFFRENIFAPYFVGIISSLFLSFYAMLSAYADGRFIWTAYPFMIPMAVAFIRERSQLEATRLKTQT